MQQILKDVKRTMWNWSFSRADRHAKQAALCRVLVKAFAQNKGAKHYFQGCNEVASMLLFALGETQAVVALDWLMNHTLTRWFELSLPPLVELMANIMPLLDLADGEVYQLLRDCDIESPTFALSWLMTWFAHNTEDIQALFKVYDVLFDIHEGDAVAIIYMAAQTIIMCKEDLLSISRDMPRVHEYFTRELPPIVTREKAARMLSNETETDQHYYPRLGLNKIKVLPVEDIVEGSKKLFNQCNWDELKRHAEELTNEQEEHSRNVVYRANAKHDSEDAEEDDSDKSGDKDSKKSATAVSCVRNRATPWIVCAAAVASVVIGVLATRQS